MAIIVKLLSIVNAGPRQTGLIQRAASRLQDAVNHASFDDRVVNSYYRERRWRSTDRRVVHVPPKDIYARIRAGRERATGVDGEINLSIHLKPLGRGTRGSTTLGLLPIRTAYWFIRDCLEDGDAATLAGHFMHEWLHVSGFFHYPDNSAREDVPYQVGYIVRDILIDHFSEPNVPKNLRTLEETDCGCTDDAHGGEEPPDDADGEMM
jgi:hypothetical protein